MRSIVTLLACVSAFVGTSTALAQQGVQEAEIDFFRGVQTGETFRDVPEGMSRPSELSRIFAGQSRFIDWASNAEEELTRAVSRFDSGEIVSQRVRCKSSICEVILVVLGNSENVSSDLSQHIGAAAQILEKEMTIAISTTRPGRTAVLLYLHDEGEGQ